MFWCINFKPRLLTISWSFKGRSISSSLRSSSDMLLIELHIWQWPEESISWPRLIRWKSFLHEVQGRRASSVFVILRQRGHFGVSLTAISQLLVTTISSKTSCCCLLRVFCVWMVPFLWLSLNWRHFTTAQTWADLYHKDPCYSLMCICYNPFGGMKGD